MKTKTIAAALAVCVAVFTCGLAVGHGQEKQEGDDFWEKWNSNFYRATASSGIKPIERQAAEDAIKTAFVEAADEPSLARAFAIGEIESYRAGNGRPGETAARLQALQIAQNARIIELLKEANAKK